MTTYESLYAQRCDAKGNPHYWNPQKIEYARPTLFGDDDLICEDSWGVDETIKRVLALGLWLELPVGQWVYDARKSELNIPDSAKELLKSNIKDEAAHERGFRMAADVYPVDEKTYNEAGLIAQQWLDNSEHPLAKAAISEVGIFLVTLGVMRVCGGRSLCSFAARISHDEARHVSTDRSVLFDTGYRPDMPSNSLMDLRRDTLAWSMEHLNIPADETGGDTLNADYLIEQSDSLIKTGEAPDFDDLVYFASHVLPFEVGNSEMYDRVPEEYAVA